MTFTVVPASILSLPGKLLGSVAGAPVKVAAKVGLDAVSSWVVAGAEAMLKEVVKVIGTVTTPSLSLSWFSASYWQMSALAMLLTLPFLFAAAVQAVIQTNVGILVRAACVDLPIAAIAVTLAAPLITLMLAATDQMCSLVGGGGTVGGGFLTHTAAQLSGAGNGFMLVVIAVVILLAGMMLLLELIMRSAAIYVVVLFLPLGFAAMVWPARRVWVKRMLETLIALILSKFAMVAILSMSVAALASLTASPSPLTTAFTAMALTVLATLSPWALLRLLPFTEVAAGAALMLHQDARQRIPHRKADSSRSTAEDIAGGLTVDPLMDGLGALRNFVTANALDDSGRGAGGPGRGLRSGGGGELPPGPGPTPGAGPDPAGSGGGGAATSILPAEAGAAASVLTARSPGGGSAAGATAPGTSRAAVTADGSPASTESATEAQSSPSSSAPAEAQRPPAPAPVSTGSDLSGGTPPPARDSAEPTPMPDWGPAFEPEQAVEFNLAEPGRGFLLPPEGPGEADGDQPEAGKA